MLRAVLCFTLALAACTPTSSPRFRLDLGSPEDVPPGGDARITVRFTAPSGATSEVDAFWDGDRYRARFTPAEAGTWRWQARFGRRLLGRGELSSSEPARGDFVHADGRRLETEEGTVFVPLGVNRFNVYDPSWNYRQMQPDEYVDYIAEHGMNTMRLFIFTDCEDESRADRVQLGCLEPRVGRFDARAAARYDRVFAAAEEHDVKIILTLFAVGFTPNETWKSWEDNPYNVIHGGPARAPEDFFTGPAARAAAMGRLRYVLARWGSSPSLLAIDLMNEPEWDGRIPERVWSDWAQEMAEVWKERDPYVHPVTVGSVGLHWNIGGDERRWWSDAGNDIVQWHLYGKETYDVHALARTMTRKVEETVRHGRPILVGEFGYGGEAVPLHDHTHVGIWSATFSSAGVLAHAAPPFNIDSDMPMMPARAAHFRTLARFLALVGEPFEALPSVALARSDWQPSVWVARTESARAIWILAPRAGYGSEVDNLRIVLQELPAGTHEVNWYDDVTGALLARRKIESAGGSVAVQVPAFVRHIAGIVRLEPEMLGEI